MSRLIFTAIVATVIFTATAHAACSDNTDCYSCTNSYSGDCGWNDQYGTCQTGDPNTQNPIGYDYTPTWWAWKTDRCCSQHYSCTGCTSVDNSRCGWSANQGSCAYNGNNQDGSQITQEYMCPSQSDCDYNWDCSSCLENGNCGWDSNEQTCSAGTSSGPYSGWSYSWHYDNCPDRVWAWNWNANSAPMWFTVVGVVGFCFCVCACCAGRRRRKILREQNRQGSLINNAAPASANAPLMGQPVYSQPAPPAFYGTPAAYTQPGAPVGALQQQSAAPVAHSVNLYGPSDDTPQIEDCSKP